MAFPENLFRVSFRGSLTMQSPTTTVLEEFVHNLTLQYHGDIETLEEREIIAGVVADGCISRWEDHWQDIRARFCLNVKYDEVRAYALDTDGHTLALASGAISDVRGTSSAPCLPFECALAVSLYSTPAGDFNAAGRKGRGRFYLPPISTSAIDGEGLLAAAAQGEFSTWATELLDDIQGMNASTGHLDVVVASNVDATARQVNQIRIGQVLDVQRRRRRSLNEDYMNSVLTNH